VGPATGSSLNGAMDSWRGLGRENLMRPRRQGTWGGDRESAAEEPKKKTNEVKKGRESC